MGGKRFAVLLCAEDSEYVTKKYGGYFGVFVNLLGEKNINGGEENKEIWNLYRVVRGEFPEEDDIDLYDGFVISGSCNDAHGNDVWILKLLNLLKKLDSLKKKILGICFGHQILCRALGGKTGRAASGWDLGMTTIRVSPISSTSIEIPSKLAVIECHRDEVIELPPSAKVIGSSDKTKVEMYTCGNHILGLQGHPEYTKDILHSLLDRLLERKFIKECQAELARASIEASEPDREAWKRICRGFLKGELVL
ncbi:glucosinolate gamma-glutamyl hydrolase [Ranunculus cassubicifolius]